MKKTSGIYAIIWYRYNGMYTDFYDVVYSTVDGGQIWKRFTVHGEMTQKHFDYIMSHDAKPHYRKNGYHNYDVYGGGNND